MGAISHMPGSFPATPGAQRQDSYGMPSTQSYQRMPPQAVNRDYLHPTYATAGTGADEGSRSNSEPSLDPHHASGGSYDGGSERASEASHFTSISDRPVNPNWRPGPASEPGGNRGPPGYAGGTAYGGQSSAAAVQRRRDDMILGGNPDFSIGGMRSGPRARGPPMAASNVGGGGGLAPMGRYPTDI